MVEDDLKHGDPVSGANLDPCCHDWNDFVANHARYGWVPK